MPVTWLDELKAAYPKRSGPMSWPRVFLKVRGALLETRWDDCIAGVKRYAKYCQEAGIEGSAFVITPARFFEDEIYLEDLTFTPAEDPKIVEHRSKEADRLARAREAGARIGLEPMPGECSAAFETRIMLENQRPGRGERRETDHVGASGESELHMRSSESVQQRISSLAHRLRIAK